MKKGSVDIKGGAYDMVIIGAGPAGKNLKTAGLR